MNEYITCVPGAAQRGRCLADRAQNDSRGALQTWDRPELSPERSRISGAPLARAMGRRGSRMLWFARSRCTASGTRRSEFI
jgi:hypothetical protein